MAPILVIAVQKAIDYGLSHGTAQAILVILGIIVGSVVAHFAQEKYQSAYNGWPWLTVSLLVPAGTALVAAALMVIVGLVILVVTVVIYLLGIALAIACLCGMCEGA